MENSFLYTPAEALEHFNVTEQSGLTSDAVVQSKEKYGPNGKHCKRLTPRYTRSESDAIIHSPG